MPRFRPPGLSGPRAVFDIPFLALDVLLPAHFYVGSNLQLEWEHAAPEEISWEIFRGRLLDPAQTRERRTFEAWNVYQVAPDGRSAEPLLSLKWDAAAGVLYVVRGIDSYVWEGYDAGGGVILSRERRKWVRELVGTVNVSDFAHQDDLRDELICLLFLAVVGTSRLPLTSVEAPLPAFSFGQLLYCHGLGEPSGEPVRSHDALAEAVTRPGLNPLERVKLLEEFLHAVPPAELPKAAGHFDDAWVQRASRQGIHLFGLLYHVFNGASLSPYTGLAEKTVAFLDALEQLGSMPLLLAVDFLGWLLRQIGRHLTAYDLVAFHHRGANYPDALVLDVVLKAYLARIERKPHVFLDAPGDRPGWGPTKRRRRRALRQGWLLRRRYEGWPVPDAPTSPGENNRVLPPSHPRVPEEQILQPSRRTRRLYDGDPLPRRLGKHAAGVLRQSAADLQRPEELRELGMALFLDRPFGAAKAVAEPDDTLLLASEAYSPTIAEQRLQALAREPGLLPDAQRDDCLRRLREGAETRGLPLDAVGGDSRPGTVSLTDARLATPDFVLLRTTPGGVRALLGHYDFTALAEKIELDWLLNGSHVLVARNTAGPGVLVYDAELRPQLELIPQTAGGYVSRAGQEYPREGLSVRRLTQSELRAEKGSSPGDPSFCVKPR
jgi:hypothetical protein